MQTERNAELLSTLVAGGFDAKAKQSSPESRFEPIPQVTHKLSQTTLSHITLSHNLVAHNFVTQNLLHTTSSHITLSLLIFRTNLCVAGMALGDIHCAVASHLWHSAGLGGTLIKKC